MTEPKYPMPALTEQEREDAIKHCKSVIKATESWLRFNKEVGNPETFARMQLKCAHVTLAALTAEHPQVVGYISEVIDSGRFKGDANGRVSIEEGMTLYTAPPVPVLKTIELRSRIEDIHLRTPLEVEDMYRQFFRESIHAAGYGVKE